MYAMQWLLGEVGWSLCLSLANFAAVTSKCKNARLVTAAAWTFILPPMMDLSGSNDGMLYSIYQGTYFSKLNYSNAGEGKVLKKD
jgi:hypothetical protein